MLPRPSNPSSQNTATIEININDDDICEDTESYNVTILTVEGGRPGWQCWSCFNITDEDSKLN